MRTEIQVAAILIALPFLGAGSPAFGQAEGPLPEGSAGVAAGHPGDKGIGEAPGVVFAEDFDGCSSVADLRATWDVLTNEGHLAIADAPGGGPGRGKSLMMTIPRQEAPLATGVAKLLAHTENVLFLRWYQMFDTGWFVPDGSVHNGGSMSSRYYDHGHATPGIPADGKNKFLVSFENENSTGDAPGNMDAYVYWPEQASQWGDHFYPSGYVLPFSAKRSGEATFGKRFVARPDFSPLTGRWYCYEYMVRANTPGARDGRVAMWVDGKLVADFPNLRLRDTPALGIDRFDLGLYIAHNTKRPNRKWVDDVVAATSYIGPMEPSTQAPFLVDVSRQQPLRVGTGANAALAAGIATVVDKPQPSPTGDARDYVSYARYYWPNPDTPSHLPFVRRDGSSNERQVALGDEPRLVSMQDNVGKLALGWAVLRRADCARRAGEWLRAWFIDPRTSMHPNLDRAQIALGHDGNRGRGEGILDARGFIGLVDALRMLHGSPALTDGEEASVLAWFGQYLQWMLTSSLGEAEHKAANNHGSWFLAQAIAVARYVGRDDEALQLAKEDYARISSQIAPDGSQPLELSRADGLGYSIFNLKAQFLIARLSEGLGLDLSQYTAPNGASLARAVGYLRPYNADPASWPGHQVSKLKPGFLNEITADGD